MSDREIFDTVIIGAGPAGLTAALFASNKNFKITIVEGLEAGGQLKSLYPLKPVYNYPGYSQINAGELAEMMLQQVRQKNIPVIENTPVETVTSMSNGHFQIKLKNQLLESRSVILACGMGLFRPRRLNVPGEQELENRQLFYSITYLAEWEEREVALFGGGNSAVDNALLLSEKNARVTLIHRLAKFNADAASVEKLQQQGVEILLGWKVRQFSKTADGRVEIWLENGSGGEQKTLVKERVLVNIGLQPNLDFLQQLPVEKKGRQVAVDSEMQTSVPGIFACGDVVVYPGKVRLIATAIGEAATAVSSMERYLKSVDQAKEKVNNAEQ